MNKNKKLICSKCNERFYRETFKFCPFDGTPIKWEEGNEMDISDEMDI